MPARIWSIALAVPVAGSIAALLSAQAPAQVAPPAAVSFARDVDPILEDNCRSCHSDVVQLGKLDLSTRESALRGGARGADIVAGNAEASRLYRRIAGLEQPTMPAQGTPLTAAQVAAVKQWIDEGAKWTGCAARRRRRSRRRPRRWRRWRTASSPPPSETTGRSSFRCRRRFRRSTTRDSATRSIGFSRAHAARMG